jgi:hypothetical protein
MYEFRHTFSGVRLFWTVAECLDGTYVPYVVSLHTQRRGNQCWQGAWQSQYAKERILIWVPCICSWYHETSGFRHRSHHQDPNRMATEVKWRHSAPTASEDDEKANTAGDEKTSAGLTTAYFRRTWQHNMWFNGKIVCGLMVKSLHAVHSSKIYRQHRTTIITFGAHLLVRLACHHRITTTMFKSTSTDAIPPSCAKWVSIFSLLHRCVEYTSTRRLHLPKCVFTIPVMVRGDVQAVSGRRTGR